MNLPTYQHLATEFDEPQNVEILQWQKDQYAIFRDVTCGHPDCDEQLSFHHGYKCLYCGVVYCRAHAEKHFGKTIDQFYDDKVKSSAKVKNTNNDQDQPTKDLPNLWRQWARRARLVMRHLRR